MRRFWDNLPLRAKVLAVVAIAALPLSASVLFALSSARSERDAEDWVEHTIEVKSQIEATLALTSDATASVDAFLLTRDPQALGPIMQMGTAWTGTLTRLVALVRDNPTQVARLREIQALQGNNWVKTLVDYGRTHGSEPVPAAVLQQPQRTLRTFRDILGRMQVAEDQLLQARMADRRRAESRKQLWTLAGSCLGVLGSLLAAFAFSSGTARRIRKVRDDADRVARGDELPPAAGERRDELGQLAQSISRASVLLKERDAQLETRMSELSAVNQELEAFSYSVSHDLRAPLRHITGFASLLEATSGDHLTGEDRRRLRTISEAAGRMGRLIDDLLAFSRMGRAALTKRRVRLADLIEEARRELGAHHANDAAAWTIHPLPEVDADPAMMHLVFVNLLGNALKYTRPGEPPVIEIGTNASEAPETVVYVRDKGVGFDMQYAGKLFGVFQRLHSSDQFEGTGIGLANVRRIVHRHGGRVWAEGAVNAGATFYFSLPAETPAS